MWMITIYYMQIQITDYLKTNIHLHKSLNRIEQNTG